MPLKRCSISRLVLNAVRLGLLVTWLGLTGLKIAHFLSEPTSLRSRLDHKFKPPFITVQTASPLPKSIGKIVTDGSDKERNELFANQTLRGFIRSHGLTLAEFSGVTNMTDEERRRRRSETTLKTAGGTWNLITTGRGAMSATLIPSSSHFYLNLPRRAEFATESGYESSTLYCFWVIFHSEPDFWRFDTNFHVFLPIRNVSLHRDVKVVINREVRRNLRRQPCENDPLYDINACQRKCFFNWINCSLGKREDSEKPRCMASDFPSYRRAFYQFFRQSDDDEEHNPPITRCGCPRPCVRDRISYITLSDVTKSSNTSFKVFIKLGRVRRTMVMVVSYGLEDLLADIGGYLGLLLGVSLLSLFGNGQRLVRHLARRRCRQAADKQQEDADDSTEKVGSVDMEEMVSIVTRGSSADQSRGFNIDTSVDLN